MRLKRQGTQLVSELQMRTSLSQDIDGCRKDTTMGPKETEREKKKTSYHITWMNMAPTATTQLSL